MSIEILHAYTHTNAIVSRNCGADKDEKRDERKREIYAEREMKCVALQVIEEREP